MTKANNPTANGPRALFITRKWPPAMGGMETYSVEFARAAARLVTLDTITLPGHKNGSPPGALAIIGFGIKSVFQLFYKAPRTGIIHGGDLALWPLVWIAGLYAPRARLSIAAHGSDIGYAFRTTWRGALYRYYMRLGVRFLKNTFIATNSRATTDLVTKIGFKHVTHIPLGVEDRYLKRTKTRRPKHLETGSKQAPNRHKFGSGQESCYLLFAGRLLDRKGCGWFIKYVLPRLPDTVRLNVAGQAVTSAEQDALDHPRVSFLGSVYGDDLDNLRRAALAVIVPNIDFGPAAFEGFGLAALEAAAAGGVVLAADLYGLKDAIIHEHTGFLIPAGDALAWQAAIMRVHDWSFDTRRAFILKARKTIIAHGGWDQTVKQTLGL